MSRTTDIGARIELVPMDPHFHEITIGLYLQDHGAGAEYHVHSYTGLSGADDRLRFVVEAMVVIGGMERTPQDLLRFPCGHEHQLGCRRLFLEACKIDPQTALAVRPLSVFDKKAGCEILATPEGNGVYRVGAQGNDVDRRIWAIAGGLIKLGQMEDLAADQVKYPCGQDHDELLGVLLVRAPNVRAILREQEQTASRGRLAAPSQQE
jgi:hypothetical protein